MQLPIVKVKDSKWIFETSATGGLGVAIFTASGGLIELKDPDANEMLYLHYGGGGVGASLGGKLPKIPKVPKIDLKGKSGAGSTTTFTSHGEVWVLSGCHKNDLDPIDFQGPTLFIDGGAGVIVGYSGTLLLAGLDPWALAKVAALNAIAPALYHEEANMKLIQSAKALILVHGYNAGAQIGGGISGNIGYIHLSKITDMQGSCTNDAEGFCRP